MTLEEACRYAFDCRKRTVAKVLTCTGLDGIGVHCSVVFTDGAKGATDHFTSPGQTELSCLRTIGG